MDVRRQHINLECTGKRTSGAKREQVTHWGGHAMAMIVATHGTQDFSIVLMGKALKRRVVFLLASAPASTSLNILYHSGQTKYCNTEKRGLEGGKKAGREKHVSKVKGSERVVSTDVCLLKTFSKHFWIRPCPFWKKPDLLRNTSMWNSLWVWNFAHKSIWTVKVNHWNK